MAQSFQFGRFSPPVPITASSDAKISAPIVETTSINLDEYPFEYEVARAKVSWNGSPIPYNTVLRFEWWNDDDGIMVGMHEAPISQGWTQFTFYSWLEHSRYGEIYGPGSFHVRIRVANLFDETISFTVTQTPPPPPIAKVVGFITNAENQQPVIGAGISWGDYSAESVANGYYEFTFFDGQSAAFIVEKEGFETHTSALELPAGQNKVLDVALNPSGAPPVPPGQGKIHGNVTHSALGAPLPFVNVAWGDLTTVSTAEGYYELTFTEGQSALLTASLPGYETYSEGLSAGPGDIIERNISLMPITEEDEPAFLEKIENALSGIFFEGMLIQDALAEFGLIPDIIADIFNAVIDLFTINISPPDMPPIRVAFLGGAAKIAEVPKVSAAAGAKIVDNLIKKGAPKIISMSLSNPEKLAARILSLSETQLTRLFAALASNAAGRQAIYKIIQVTGEAAAPKFTAQAGLSGLLYKAPKAVLTFFGILWILKFIGFELPGFIANFRKEIPEAPGMAVWQTIENAEQYNTIEAWLDARRANQIYKDFTNFTDAQTASWVSLNPALAELYLSSSDSQRAQQDAFDRIIDKALESLGEARKGMLIIVSNVTGANIYIDGEFTGKTPFSQEWPEGSYNALVSKSGYIDEAKTVQVIADTSTQYDFTLLSADEAPPELQARITIKSDPPGAKIYLNTAYEFEVTDTTILKAPGSYELTLKKDGYYDDVTSFSVTAGEQKTISRTLTQIIKAEEEPGFIEVTSVPPNAKIYVDYEYQFEVTPTTISVEPGARIITLKKEGYSDSSKEVTVSSGTNPSEHFTMEELSETPPEVPPEKARIVVQSEPTQAKIYVDDAYTFEATNTTVLVDPGVHKLSVKLEGYEDYETYLEIAAGETMEFYFPLTAVISPYPAVTPSISPPSAPGYPYTYYTTDSQLRHLLNLYGYVPAAPFPVSAEEAAKKGLILNIETTGLDPAEHRIISIGFQDPLLPDEPLSIIMEEDEGIMLKGFFKVLKTGNFNKLIGYGLSFDFKFLIIRAMAYGLDMKEFIDAELYDLAQYMAQGKAAFVYNAQRPPKLSDLGQLFFNYPKPFTDEEMIEYYALGQSDKVLEFASGQITRTLLLYYLWLKVSETSIS